MQAENSGKHIWNNHMYVLRMIHKAAPGRIFYDAITSVMGSLVNLASLYFVRVAVNGVNDAISYSQIILYLCLLAGVNVLYYLPVRIIDVWLEPHFAYKLQKYFKNLIFEKAETCDLSCYENPDFYEQYTLAMMECEDRAETVLDNVRTLIFFSFTVMGAGALSISIDPVLLLFLIAPFLINIGEKKRNGQKSLQRKELAKAERRKKYVNRVFFLRDYAGELKITKMPKVLMDSFTEAVRQILQIHKERGKRIAAWNVLIQMLKALFSNYLILLYAAWQTLGTGKMSYGDCLVLVTVITTLTSSLRTLLAKWSDLHEESLYIDNLRFFLDFQSSVEGNFTGEPAWNGDISLSNVSFQYSKEGAGVLKNISLDIKAGQKVAIVGENGAGKSTLIKLLLRLYDPAEGEILLAGKNIKELELESYRSIFVTLLQQDVEMCLTVGESVLMGEMETKEAKDKVLTALKECNLLKKVEKSEKGLETYVGKEYEEGIVFSGGEKQKLNLARVYAAENPIVILDEPSSALDPIAEYRMNELLMRLCKNKTMILISHRLSTVVDADKIYYMSGGSIKEAGTHRQLMERDGSYAEMFRIQAAAYKARPETK